jgi:succinate dehydrogenase / fumarate reductase flavoprotein subunit
MLDRCGITRDAEGLRSAITDIRQIREEFWSDLRVDGDAATLNQSLEYAGRVADFLEFAELMCNDALVREESCGGHFRVEHQIDGEARRDDDKFCHAAVWEYAGERAAAIRNVEPLAFENVKLATRSYK